MHYFIRLIVFLVGQGEIIIFPINYLGYMCPCCVPQTMLLVCFVVPGRLSLHISVPQTMLLVCLWYQVVYHYYLFLLDKVFTPEL